MKKAIILSLILLIALLTACMKKTPVQNINIAQPPGTNQAGIPPEPDTVCEFGNSDGCDRACINKENCKHICGAGCFNINEEYDFKGPAPMCFVADGCDCIDNICQERKKDTTNKGLENCLTWFNGCNTCQVVDGKVTQCTLMECSPDVKEESKCLEYKEGTCNKEDNCCMEDEDCKYIGYTGKCNTQEYVNKIIKEEAEKGNTISEAQEKDNVICKCENNSCTTLELNCVNTPGQSYYPGSEICCNDLKSVFPYELPDGTCLAAEDDDRGGAPVCAPCGNGKCEKDYSEDKCNCPEDCK